MDLLSLGNEDCPLSVIMANLICRSCEPFSFSLCYSFLFAALLSGVGGGLCACVSRRTKRLEGKPEAIVPPYHSHLTCC